MDERALRTRTALLDAAEELFAERGFADVGNRELVARAEVNLAAIAYHFGSKRGLYVATLRRALHRPEIQALWGLLRKPPRGREAAAERLGLFLRLLTARLLAEDGLNACTKLILREAIRPSEALEEVVRDFTRPHEELLVALLRRIAPELALPRARLAARSILGQLFHTHLFRPLLRLHGAPNELRPESAPALAEHVIEFSLRGLGLPASLVRTALAAPLAIPELVPSPERSSRA